MREEVTGASYQLSAVSCQLPDRKQLLEVGCRSRSHVLGRGVLDLSELLRRFDDEGGLVRLSAMGDRREKRGIGLDQHRFEREAARGLTNVLGRPEREHPGKGDRITQIDRLCSETG